MTMSSVDLEVLFEVTTGSQVGADAEDGSKLCVFCSFATTPSIVMPS